MKTVTAYVCIAILFFTTTSALAQESKDKVVLKKDFEVERHTLMERFEPNYVISVQKRAEMKEKRIADAEHTISVLDTMKISNRKRKQLLYDLKHNPFSDRLNQFIVDTKFQDDEILDE